MKRSLNDMTLPVALVVALVGSGCAEVGSVMTPTAPSVGTAPVGTTWEATGVEGIAPGEVLHSDLTFESEWQVTGSSGCNRYVAELNSSPPMVRRDGHWSNQVSCDPPVMEQERRFLNALDSTRTYRVDGDVMHFQDRSGRTLIRFWRRLPPPGRAPR